MKLKTDVGHMAKETGNEQRVLIPLAHFLTSVDSLALLALVLGRQPVRRRFRRGILNYSYNKRAAWNSSLNISGQIVDQWPVSHLTYFTYRWCTERYLGWSSPPW